MSWIPFTVFYQGQTPYDVADSEVLKLLEELERKQASVCNSQNKLLNKQKFMLNNTHNVMLLCFLVCNIYWICYMQSISYIKLCVITWNSLLISFFYYQKNFFFLQQTFGGRVNFKRKNGANTRSLLLETW